MAIVSYGISGDVTGTGYADMAATASYTLSNASTKIVLPTVKLRAVSSGITNARYHTLAMAQLYANGNTKYISTTRSASTSVGEYSSAVNWIETSTQTSAGVNVNTANYFTSSNKTARTVTGYVRVVANNTEYYLTRADGDIILVAPNSTKNLCTVTFTLNAPPTFTSTQVSFDTDEVYTGLTTASITTSNLDAKYGGEISSVKFTIGNQNVTSSSAGTMSILLAQEGTFTPTVSVTDKRGQTTTKSLNPITVKGYSTPSVNYTVERTGSNGVRADEGTYAVASANITFTDAIATLSAPTIKIDGTTVTPTWYSTRADDGTLSGPVNWSELPSPATVYALMGGNLSTQSSYQIGITPVDSEGSGTEITQTLPSAFYTVDFLAGGHGIAFGRAASEEGFWCDMDTYNAPLVGTVQMYAGTTAPNGWLKCDGSAVSRTTYAKLFAVIGTTYGAGDGSTTFNLPNFCGRTPIGVGESNATGHTAHTRGQMGGSEDAVIPYHKHDVAQVNITSSGGHTHTITTKYRANYLQSGTNRDSVNGGGTSTSTGIDTIAANTGTHTHSVPAHDTDYVGTSGNVTGANMMPYLGINFIIHAGIPTA